MNNARASASYMKGGTDSNILLVFAFGVIFVIVLLALAIKYPNPSPTTFFIFRVVLSLAAAGVGAAIPGFLSVKVGKLVRAGGALALFVLVYMANPPKLVVVTVPAPDSELIQRAEAALGSNDINTSLALFEEAEKANSRNWRAPLGLARAKFKRGDFGASTKDFLLAIEVSGQKEWSPYVGLAMSQEAMGQTTAAIESLTTALTNASPNGIVRNDITYDLGRLYLQQWLASEAPRQSDAYVKSERYFSEFLDSNGTPRQWALYHISCLDARRAEDSNLTKRDKVSLRKKASESLLASLKALSESQSDKAAVQKEMMKALINSPESWQHKSGEPLACPALKQIVRILQADSTLPSEVRGFL